MEHRPRYALIPGDPSRVHRLLDQLDGSAVVDGPSYLVEGTGTVSGEPVLVAATGMGGPSVVETVRRLADRGVDTFIRVGGAGPVADHVTAGDIIVASAAVRHEGASRSLLPPSFPAVADPGVTESLLAAALERRPQALCGVVHTKDSFFGEVDPASSPVEGELLAAWHAWQRLGVLASEMEASVLFCLALREGLRAGTVLKVNAIGDHAAEAWRDDVDLCRIAVDGLARLIGIDRG
ncbi:MAG: Uridine phosphorylase [Blastococcus sp.]|jgi:uridine phosphorylase|nr:Uridine phosphorylase [Blastococcus sp.]